MSFFKSFFFFVDTLEESLKFSSFVLAGSMPLQMALCACMLFARLTLGLLIHLPAECYTLLCALDSETFLATTK